MVYVKVDRSNHNAMTNALKSIMSCETLSLEGICLVHAHFFL
jgi:hypothetical protein